jgi:hypothetical protein
VTGDLATELFSIGDVGKIYAPNQQFLVASQVVGFDSVNVDGVIGLGTKSADMGGPTLIENLYQNKLIAAPVFSLFLNNNGYEKDDRRKPKSTLMIGGFDLDTYSDGSEVRVYNVTDTGSKVPGLWAVKLNSIKCKDTDIDFNSTFAVLDSRHNKIIGPKDAVKTLFDRFEAMYGCGYYYTRMVCDCSEIYSIVKFPKITINIDGDDYTFNDNHYFKKTAKVCYLMFEGADIDYWILGQPFLRQYYSIYNLENNTVSLAYAASSRFTVDTDSNWWIIPVVLIIGGAVCLFAWLGWTYYKKYSTDEKLLVEEEARGSE